MNENLQDLFGKLAKICNEIAQHESGNAQAYAAQAQQLAGVKLTPAPEEDEDDLQDEEFPKFHQPTEAELKLEQKKREMVQRDANLADECKTLADEYMQLKASKDEHLEKVTCIDKRMAEIDAQLEKLGDERDVLHRQWCAEIARPANSGIPQAPAPSMTRREWVRALDDSWTEAQVTKIAKRIGELASGRVKYSRLFYFGGYDDCTKYYTINDLNAIGRDMGMPFPG